MYHLSGRPSGGTWVWLVTNVSLRYSRRAAGRPAATLAREQTFIGRNEPDMLLKNRESAATLSRKWALRRPSRRRCLTGRRASAARATVDSDGPDEDNKREVDVWFFHPRSG
jgi:hypothetical protein